MSSLTVSKPVAQTAKWVSSEEQDICKKLNPIFPESVSTIIAEYAVDIESCPICLRDIAYPVRLGCGHLFDLDCISDWFRQKNTCPLDRTTIDIGKIQYAEEVIKKVSAVFNFHCKSFLGAYDLNPLTVNVYSSSVQRLKLLVSRSLKANEKNLIIAAFSPRVKPRAIGLCVSSSTREGEGRWPVIYPCLLLSCTLLKDNAILKPGYVYEIDIYPKFAGLNGFACDKCYGNLFLERICDHPDENEATEDATIIG